MAKVPLPDDETLAKLALETLGEEIGIGLQQVWVNGFKRGFEVAQLPAYKRRKVTDPSQARQSSPGDTTRFNIYLDERDYYAPGGLYNPQREEAIA